MCRYQPVKKSCFFILIIYLHNNSGYVTCCKINLKTMTLGNIDNWFSSTLVSQLSKLKLFTNNRQL